MDLLVLEFTMNDDVYKKEKISRERGKWSSSSSSSSWVDPDPARPRLRTFPSAAGAEPTLKCHEALVRQLLEALPEVAVVVLGVINGRERASGRAEILAADAVAEHAPSTSAAAAAAAAEKLHVVPQ